jgi:hypothetical protein
MIILIILHNLLHEIEKNSALAAATLGVIQVGEGTWAGIMQVGEEIQAGVTQAGVLP